MDRGRNASCTRGLLLAADERLYRARCHKCRLARNHPQRPWQTQPVVSRKRYLLSSPVSKCRCAGEFVRSPWYLPTICQTTRSNAIIEPNCRRDSCAIQSPSLADAANGQCNLSAGGCGFFGGSLLFVLCGRVSALAARFCG